MPFINLIQEQRASVKKGEAKARALFFGFVGITTLSILAFGYFLYRTDALQGEEATLMAETQKLQPVVTQIETEERAYALLVPRLKTLEDAQVATNRWTTILTHLQHQVPSNTWLTGIRCTSGDVTKPIAVSFLGLSNRQEAIGELILRLQNCADLQNVNLKYTQEKIVDKGSGIEFEITSEVAGSVEEKPKEEKS
jgi:Tfp pilus assembly protein PilN